MADSPTGWSLKELLTHCCDQESSGHQRAWREFYRRYDEYITNKVRKRCWSFNVPRLRQQFPETVKDIVGEVYTILFKSLHTFKNPDQEYIFRAWIITICNNASMRYLQKYYKDIFTDLDPTTAKSVLSDIPPVIGYEVFQDLVNFLRNDTGLSRRNPERDINIFLLRVWEDLNDNMIYHHPCINDPRRRLVGNVVDQYRKVLRERIF